MLKRNLSKECEIILLCTRLELNNIIQQKIKGYLSGTVDWNKIIQISNQHQILPFLYYNLEKLNIQDNLPQDIFTKIKNCYYANLHRNIALEREFSFILKATNQQNISFIPFKGLALSQTLYHNPALRPMIDVDILIKKNDFAKIKKILIQLGYCACDNEKADDEHHLKDKHEIAFSKILPSNLSLNADIHYAFAAPRPYRVNLPLLWRRIQEKSINNQTISYLSWEDTLLSLVFHLRIHTRKISLKFIVDLAELLNKYANTLDWPYIEESAKDNRITTVLYFSLYLAGALLNASVPPYILRKFYPHSIKRKLLHLTLNKDNFFTLNKYRGTFLRFLFFDTARDFFLYLWRVSFLERFIKGKTYGKSGTFFMLSS